MVYPNRVVLNINQKYVMPIPYTQQGDTARVLTFNILDKGVPFNLTGKTVRAKILKPDNTKCYNDLTITNATGGECDLKLTNQVLAVAGKVNCQLEIKEGEELLSTIIFPIDVEPSIDINGAVESTNEFTALLNGIIKLDEWDKYFKETSGAIEEKYTERLNGIDSSLEEKVNKVPGETLTPNKYTDEDKSKVSDITNKASIIYVNEKINSLSNGSPDKSFESVALLNNAYPTGDTRPKLVKTNDILYVYLWSGTQWNNAGIYGSNGVLDGQISKEKTDFIVEGKNKFNRDNIIKGKLISGAGLTDATNYGTSDYIKVYQGQQVTIQKCRCWQLTDNDKQYLDYNNTQNNNATITLTPTVDGYLRISFALSSIDSVQVEYGDTATTYEKYKNFISCIELTDEQKKSIIPILNSNADIQVIKHGDIVDIKSELSELEEIVVSTSKVGSRNGSFNFINTKINGVQVHEPTDDIAPIRIFCTVGANHGYTCVIDITQTGHDKTTVDLGSVWSDGVTEYVLLDINGNVLTLGCPYTLTDGITSSLRIAPIADLTHTSGATHTTTISKNTIASSSQLYPSINNKSIKYLIDGKEILEDGEYSGDKLQIIEVYNIMDYKDIIDYAKSHIGVSFKNDDVKGVVRLSVSYEFTKGCKCLISHSIKALKKVELGACGFIQSAPTYKYPTFKRYIPNLKPKYEVDFEHIVDMQNYNSNIYYNSINDFNDPVIPPHRVVDLIYNNNELQYGFTLGYISDKTNSKNSDRLSNISEDGYYLNIRNTKKTYPNAIGTKVLNIGEYKTFECYRNYLSKYLNGTNLTIVEDSQNTYVFIDYHKVITGMNIELNNYIGKNVTILESKNFTLMNDIVDSEGVTFNITDTYGYAVLKI